MQRPFKPGTPFRLYPLLTLISKVFALQGRGCAQIAGNFKGYPKLINFLFLEFFEIEKIRFEWLCVFIKPFFTPNWPFFDLNLAIFDPNSAILDPISSILDTNLTILDSNLAILDTNLAIWKISLAILDPNLAI